MRRLQFLALLGLGTVLAAIGAGLILDMALNWAFADRNQFSATMVFAVLGLVLSGIVCYEAAKSDRQKSGGALKKELSSSNSGDTS